MVRTQIQLPDELHRKVKQFAQKRELSLAEVVRRSLERFFLMFPPIQQTPLQWTLEPPANVELFTDPFANQTWREEANMRSTEAKLIAETLRRRIKELERP